MNQPQQEAVSHAEAVFGRIREAGLRNKRRREPRPKPVPKEKQWFSGVDAALPKGQSSLF